MRQSFPLYRGSERLPYAKGVVAEGRFVFLSGVTGEGATMAEQAVDAWTAIKARLEDLGTSCENIVQRMTFVTDMAEWAQSGTPAQRRWLQEHAPRLLEEQSTGTLIGVSCLASPAYKVEIQVVAVVDA